MGSGLSRWIEMARRYPVAPPVALFFFSLIVNGLSGFGWDSARYVAVVLSLVGAVGAAIVCGLLLWSSGSADRARLWAGLVGALVLCGLQIAALVYPEPTSVGGGVLVLVGLVLVGFGALAERSAHE